MGRCKTWTLDHGLDCGLDYGPDSGLLRIAVKCLLMLIEALQGGGTRSRALIILLTWQPVGYGVLRV